MKKACSIVSEALLDAVRVFVGVFDFMLCYFFVTLFCFFGKRVYFLLLIAPFYIQGDIVGSHFCASDDDLRLSNGVFITIHPVAVNLHQVRFTSYHLLLTCFTFIKSLLSLCILVITSISILSM